MIMVGLRCVVVTAVATVVIVAAVVVTTTISLGIAYQADREKQGEAECITNFHGFGEICCYHKPNNAGETQAMTQSLVSIVSNCFGS